MKHKDKKAGGTTVKLVEHNSFLHGGGVLE